MLSIRHIPALIVMFTTTVGGIWPMLDAKGAMLEFGFPSSIAESVLAAPVMAHAGSRTTILGLLTTLFYLRGQYAEVDTILAVYGGLAGVVDTYQVWSLADNTKWAAFRLGASWALAWCGISGLTASTL